MIPFVQTTGAEGVVAAELRIRIPGRPPTPNARYGNRGAQWAAQKRWRKTAWAIGLDAVNRSGWVAPGRARVTLIFIVPDHRNRDIDNLVASTKPLTDGLRDAGVIIGDHSGVLVWGAPDVQYVRGVTATDYLVELLELPAPTLGL